MISATGNVYNRYWKVWVPRGKKAHTTARDKRRELKATERHPFTVVRVETVISGNPTPTEDRGPTALIDCHHEGEWSGGMRFQGNGRKIAWR